ncbi:hypothetical protein MMC25_001888 [Agyrium rufum]|nr:hypothetical protein [Agyrium rufum]
MVRTIFPALALGLLSASAFALVTTGQTEVCTTMFGGGSVSPIPSKTSTKKTTSKTTLKSTVKPTVTVTPPVITSTETFTSTTYVYVGVTTDTLTFTDTVDVFVTSLETTTLTAFSTVVTTITEPETTNTIATTSGFTYPAPPGPTPTNVYKEKRNAAPNSRFNQARGFFGLSERAAARPVQKVNLAQSKAVPKQSPAQYPTAVTCTVTQEVYSTTTKISTAKATTITLPASTATVTGPTTLSTSTITVATYYTDAYVTITQTGTALIFSSVTSTSTVTDTATLIPPSPTFYAACDTPNIIQAPSGYYFGGQSYSPPSYQITIQTSPGTSYGCCVACYLDPYCKVAEFFQDSVYNELTCTLDYGDSETTCDAETVTISTVAADRTWNSQYLKHPSTQPLFARKASSSPEQPPSTQTTASTPSKLHPPTMPPLTTKPIHFSTFLVTTQVFHLTPHSFAFVNLKPLLPGHVLVSPLRCVPRLSDLSSTEVTDLFLTVQRVSRMLERVFAASALNIAMQDGLDAGQSVPHVHAHLIPRRKSDLDERGGNDRIYGMLEDEEGDVGGLQWLRERQKERAKFPAVDDQARVGRSEEEMVREAEMLAGEMRREEEREREREGEKEGEKEKL